MKEISEEQVCLNDKLRACVHEAGHLIALDSLGGYGSALVAVNSEYTRQAGQSAWTGRVTIRLEPSAKFEVALAQAAPFSWREIVGVAGFVAEQMTTDDFQGWEIAERLREAIDEDLVSASDAALIGTAFEDDGLVEHAVHLLHTRWTDVMRVAEKLPLHEGTEVFV